MKISRLLQGHGKCEQCRQLQHFHSLLDNFPPRSAHASTSHNIRPRRPGDLTALNSLDNISEQLMGQIRPAALLQSLRCCFAVILIARSSRGTMRVQPQSAIVGELHIEAPLGNAPDTALHVLDDVLDWRHQEQSGRLKAFKIKFRPPVISETWHNLQE